MQFRTKARAVDLLGKGQIADLPTAITELWKNGYDAYADNLGADLFRKGYQGLAHNYFILSDDGKGMSASDILDKWLVLGTDSKSRAELDVESEETLWKKPRIKAGEKGIGRLSVAYLGNPMLMLTKKLGYPIQAVYFDWRLLENYNLFLEDITVPLQTVNDFGSFDNIFRKLKSEFLVNFEKSSDLESNPIWTGKQQDLKDDIIASVLDSQLEDPILERVKSLLGSDEDHGTLFLIFNPISQILELSRKDEDGVEDQKFVLSSLVGFTNPFKEFSSTVNTKFNEYSDQEVADLLQIRGGFFSRADFELADVYIKGEFDGNGSFKGKIRIYDEIIDYDYKNSRKKDKRSYYGIIPLELGYSQGNERESKLSDTQFSALKKKLEDYGGLYVFRDEFRILPYGRENADFLNFEGRRSKRAGTHYFSYRRMYGYLDLTRERNPQLRDKSSREGLINNAQYRAFTNDAIGFFKALALDYFSTNPKHALFKDKKAEQEEQHKALKARLEFMMR
ncbi:MAG: ATP-binding protein [Bacteroidota bacterium]